MAEGTPSNKATGPDPVKDPATAGEPRAAGTGGPGGSNAPEPTVAERSVSEDDVRAEARRQVEEFNKQVRSGGASRYSMAQMMTETQAEPIIWEVVVDEWGSAPTLVRGQRVTEDTSPYDPFNAEARGILRRLTVAEMRSQTPHPYLPLTGDGLAVDEALLMAGRFHAGFRSPAITGTLSDPNGNPVTVTTPGEFAEPEGQSKPVLPVLEGGAPAARPVITVERGQDTRAAVDDYFDKQSREREAGVREQRREQDRETAPERTAQPAAQSTAPKK